MSAVDQRVGTGASRVRRLLSRALLVAGGTLAGTAAAWALSTAPASAQVPIDHDAVTGITQSYGRLGHDRIEEALPEVGLTPVGQAVRDLDVTLRAPQVREPNPPELGRVAEELRGAVGQVGTWFQPVQPVRPEQADADLVGGTVAQRATETTPVATAVPVSAGTPVVQGVFAQFSRTWPAATSWQPVPAPSQDGGRSLPGDPSGLPSLPLAPPLGAPVHCSCGGDGSGSSGGGSGHFTTASTDRIDSAVARALFPATVRTAVMPGKQPGITPD